MRVASALIITHCCVSASGYVVHPGKGCAGPPTERTVPSRRDILRGVGAAFVGASAMGLVTTATGGEALAAPLTACRANARNCIRTAWTPPAGKSKSDAIRDVREAVASYPKGGQSGVDCNGWTVATDDLDGGKASARVEYKSCIGPAAVSMNLARPFIDDLKLEVGEDEIVQVRSSSRIGSSDFGVNKKRVNYLAAALRAKGWDAPKITYGIGSYDALF